MVGKARIRQQLVCRSLDEINAVAEQIVEIAGDKKVWLFEGEMGAGKTTLIKTVCEVFGIVDTVHSPTFSIVNEYRNSIGEVFYHFDFYRLKDETEALDIGAEEYFDSGDYCFIEWPSKVENILPEDFFKVDIIPKGQSLRVIDLSRYE